MRFDARARFASIRGHNGRQLETCSQIQIEPVSTKLKTDYKQRIVLMDESGVKFFDENGNLALEIDWQKFYSENFTERFYFWVNGKKA